MRRRRRRAGCGGRDYVGNHTALCGEADRISYLHMLGAAFEDGRAARLIVVSDAREGRLRKRPGEDVRGEFRSAGVGKPHMAQAGLAAGELEAAISTAAGIARAALEAML